MANVKKLDAITRSHVFDRTEYSCFVNEVGSWKASKTLRKLIREYLIGKGCITEGQLGEEDE